MNEKRVRSTTSLSLFLTCRRKFELRNVRRLRPIASPNWSRWGRAFHLFDESYHSGLPFLEALSNARNVFWDDREMTESLQNDWEDLVQIAGDYVERYPVLVGTSQDNSLVIRELKSNLLFRPELNEVPFRIPIFTPGGRKSAHAEYTGIFDGIVEDGEGNLWVYETKTAASVTDAFFEKLNFDRQVLRYVYAARQIFGPRVQGVLYNAILKTAPRRPDRRQDGTLSTAAVVTTPEMLRDELRACRLASINQEVDVDITELVESLELSTAPVYLAHVIEGDIAWAWERLLDRAQDELPAAKEKVLKRIAKARLDNEKYRELLATAEKRLFFERRFHLVSESDLEEIEWELYQLDRDIYLAEMDGRFFPNDRACDQMGGCEFRSLCLKGDHTQYEEAPPRQAIQDQAILTPTNPRPIRSALKGILEGLYEREEELN